LLAAQYEKLARETRDATTAVQDATTAMQSISRPMLARVDSIDRMMRDVS
jgi:hypothetical protein